MIDISIRSQLDKAAEQLTILERQIERKNNVSSCAIKKALVGFISSIPSSRSLSGCKDSCSLFCRCDPDLYTDEKQERHELFMRYFAAREAAEKFISEVEQASFALPGVKRGYEVARKQTQVKRQLHSEEVQLEFQL